MRVCGEKEIEERKQLVGQGQNSREYSVFLAKKVSLWQNLLKRYEKNQKNKSAKETKGIQHIKK